MYQKFFGLREKPFNVNPDPRYLFLTPSTQEALASLTYGIQSRKGIILLSGEVGTGKTTLLNKLLDWLRQKQGTTAFIFSTQLSVNELLDYMMADFGISCESRAKNGLRFAAGQARYRWRKLRATSRSGSASPVPTVNQSLLQKPSGACTSTPAESPA